MALDGWKWQCNIGAGERCYCRDGLVGGVEAGLRVRCGRPLDGIFGGDLRFIYGVGVHRRLIVAVSRSVGTRTLLLQRRRAGAVPVLSLRFP